MAEKMKPYLIFVAILINFSGHNVSGATTGPRPHEPFSEPENPNMVDSDPPPQMGRMAGLPKLPNSGQPTTGTYQTLTYPLNGYQTTQTTGYQAPTTYGQQNKGYPTPTTYGQQNTGYQPTTSGTPTTTAVVPVPVAPGTPIFH